MRSRNIKPGFFKNEELVQLPEAVRLLFIGLWCLADRKGRLEDRPAKIKMEIYPCDPHDISTMLEQLQHHAFILRYEAKGNRYIQIINFEKHQYPHIREQESTIPAPCKPGASTMQARLNPSSLNPSSSESLVLNTASPGQPGVLDFESIWTRYPSRTGRKAAERSFRASVRTPKDYEEIQHALHNYLQSKRVKDGFIQNGSTWFNDWQGWVQGDPTNAPYGSPRPVSFRDRLRKFKETEILREDPPAGEISSGVRDMPDVPAETSPGPRR